MKPSHRRNMHSFSPGWTVAMLVVVPTLAPGIAAAQGVQAAQVVDSVVEAPRERSLWIEPRITVQQTITNNAQRTAVGESDQLTQVSPGVRAIVNGARLKGFFDYSLRGTYYAQGTGSNHFDHLLNSKATFEAVEQRAFVDVLGVVRLQPISVFGAPVDDRPASSNASQTSVFQVSPYLRGRLGGQADYEARYSIRDTRTDTGLRSNVTVQDWLLHAGRRAQGQLFGWSLDAKSQDAAYSRGRDVSTDTLRGSLSYAATPQLVLTVIGGREFTNQVSPTREAHGLVGVGADWRPSERTQVSLNREQRYFGNSHNVLLQHRTAGTVWRYTDVQGIFNGLGGAQSASLGSLYDLLDSRYIGLEADSIRRAQLVFSELDRLGLPADTQVFQDFLTSSSILRRLQQLSLALLGRRDTLTLAVSRSDNRRLVGALNTGDDFDAFSRIRQHGWSVLYAHRLTPLTSVNARLSESRSVGAGISTSPETRIRSLSVGLNTTLGERTTGGLQLRRSLSDGNVNSYRELALIGTVIHRF